MGHRAEAEPMCQLAVGPRLAARAWAIAVANAVELPVVLDDDPATPAFAAGSDLEPRREVDLPPA